MLERWCVLHMHFTRLYCVKHECDVLWKWKNNVMLLLVVFPSHLCCKVQGSWTLLLPWYLLVPKLFWILLDVAHLQSHKSAGHNLSNQGTFLTNNCVASGKSGKIWSICLFGMLQFSSTWETSVLEFAHSTAERVKSEQVVLVMLVLTYWTESAGAQLGLKHGSRKYTEAADDTWPSVHIPLCVHLLSCTCMNYVCSLTVGTTAHTVFPGASVYQCELSSYQTHKNY